MRWPLPARRTTIASAKLSSKTSAQTTAARTPEADTPRVWGPTVYRVMRFIKRALDPDDLLNPGVLFSSDPWWATWGGLEARAPM